MAASPQTGPGYPMHHTVVVVDVSSFSSRDNRSQLEIRAAMYEALRHAFEAAAIPWDSCTREDRGDGALILVPATVSKVPVVALMPLHLAESVAVHNAASAEDRRFGRRSSSGPATPTR